MERYSSIRDDLRLLRSNAITLVDALDLLTQYVHELNDKQEPLSNSDASILKVRLEINEHLLSEYRYLVSLIRNHPEDEQAVPPKAMADFEVEYIKTRSLAQEMLSSHNSTHRATVRMHSRAPSPEQSQAHSPTHSRVQPPTGSRPQSPVPQSEFASASSRAVSTQPVLPLNCVAPLATTCTQVVHPLPVGATETVCNVPHSISTGGLPSHEPFDQASDSVSLPAVKLPHFSGNQREWMNFRDLFIAMVHSHKRLTPVVKLVHLRSCLSGVPAAVIEHLSLCNDDYDVAWQALLERYDDAVDLSCRHVEAIAAFPAIKKESYSALYGLVQQVKSSMHALKKLGQPIAPSDVQMTLTILSKLDHKTRRAWELQRNRGSTIADLLTHLQDKARALERLPSTTSAAEAPLKLQVQKVRPLPFKTNSQPSSSAHVFASSSSQRPLTCTFCTEKEHISCKCPIYSSASDAKKLEMVRAKFACLNCLRAGHNATNCRTTYRCNVCNRAHHSSLHTGLTKTNRTVAAPPTDDNDTVVVCASSMDKQFCILPTVQVLLIHQNRSIVARALLDSGSQTCVMSTSCCEKLQLPTRPIKITVGGIGGSESSVKKTASARICSRQQNFARETRFLVMDLVTSNVPSAKIDVSALNIPCDVTLADTTFNIPAPVDVIIGGDLFWASLAPESFKPHGSDIMLQLTKFGWVVVGRAIPTDSTQKMRPAVYCSTLAFDLERFWTLEEVPVTTPALSQEELKCEEMFDFSTTRDATGRFIVRLPCRELPPLPNNYSKQIAERRLQSLERRFTKDTSLHKQYDQFMREYITLGHMSVANVSRPAVDVIYLPHHAVSKVDSLTTKIRVVFDASCVCVDSYSLNDFLLRGPILQDDLVSLLLRFRTHRYAVTADIVKMYRQILVDERDRHMQCILWRDTDNVVKTFELNTVTYGTKSASFLATRCLKFVGEQAEDPYVKSTIVNDFYMDDLLTGADDESQLKELCVRIQTELAKYQLPLAKWRSNSSLISDRTSPSTLQLVDKQRAKTLGLTWDASTDSLNHALGNVPLNNTVITKRIALSVISHIFDPLGLLAPVLLRAKLFLQQMWLIGADWDTPLPSAHQDSFQQFVREIADVDSMIIPRRATTNLKYDVHVFVDASQSAYCAAVYLRSTANNTVTTNLLCAKTRLAPLKTRTVPCLELCGAVLGVSLAKAVVKSLNLVLTDHVTFWSDSSVALSWLQKTPHRLSTFVSHRVTLILEATRINQWRHVRTKINPADLATRGLLVTQWRESALWWHGPPFLARCKTTWPAPNLPLLEALPEMRKVTVLVSHEQEPVIDLKRFSSFPKLLRTVAYVVKFIRRDNLTMFDAIQHARTLVFKLAQHDSYSAEVTAIRENRDLPRHSKLAKLTPFIDDSGVLRARGRMSDEKVLFTQRHPAILSSHHVVAKLIMEQLHKVLLHAGPQLLISEARRTVWIQGARNLAKGVCKKCIVCFRFKPSNVSPLMGNLPECRTTPTAPFSRVGVDYAGPLILQTSHLRNAKCFKSYVAIFVCMVTRAVHLELVTELSTDAFLACLRRFVARRGVPAHIYSDNGTNFVGANGELQRLYKCVNMCDVERELTETGCQWHFIPASSPHFGGLWESAVKCMKHHLRRTLQDCKLTFEEVYTILCQVESILNSRPMSPLYDDPDDPTPLTPGHFLIGRNLLSVPSDTHDAGSSRLRFRRLQAHVRQFWRAWRASYLRSLHQRTKWNKDKGDTVKEGGLVLVKNENTPPNRWETARIIQTHPGRDGVTRVATVRFANGSITTRPIIKLYPLPVDEV